MSAMRRSSPAAVQAAGEAPAAAPWWRRPRRQAAGKARRGRWSASDLLLAACGLGLGLVCAYFPWYVFVHQDQFGPPRVRFSGPRDAGPIPADATPAGARIRADSEAPLKETVELPLDAFTTGTLPAAERPEPPSLDQQPFPAPGQPIYRVVHITNGRAMVEDDRGLWIVERGSLLPDGAKVRSVEQRNGRWVVVTDNNVLEPQL